MLEWIFQIFKGDSQQCRDTVWCLFLQNSRPVRRCCEQIIVLRSSHRPRIDRGGWSGRGWRGRSFRLRGTESSGTLRDSRPGRGAWSWSWRLWSDLHSCLWVTHKPPLFTSLFSYSLLSPHPSSSSCSLSSSLLPSPPSPHCPSPPAPFHSMSVTSANG